MFWIVYFLTSVSKDWHHAGKDRALLCTECRLYYKKYGEERPLDSRAEPPPYLFKPVKDENATSGSIANASGDENKENGKHAMRTRRSKDSVSCRLR